MDTVTSVDHPSTVSTESGPVAEHEEHQLVDGEDLTARRLWLCVTRDGLIIETTGFYTGEWTTEPRARHADETPMLRRWTW